MRLWSLHPRYLDTAGLLACWREGLLARAVLCGTTVGYRHHPQLERFRSCANPVAAVDGYLMGIWSEAQRRGYRFDVTKIGQRVATQALEVTAGQLAFEAEHLRQKLAHRAPHLCAALDVPIEPHPLFYQVEGNIENWEKRQ